MTEIYGHRWSSSYGDTPNESWTEALVLLEKLEIKRGIDTLLDECLEWPPTLTEFVSFCRPRKSAINAAYHKLFMLPPPAQKTAEGRKAAMATIASLGTTMDREEHLSLHQKNKIESRNEINQEVRARAMQ